jgi:release factor glutamine methyltransferase
MTVGEAYKKGIERLKQAGNEAPANDAGALLCFAAGRDRAFLFAHGADALDDGLWTAFSRVLERRAAGEPLQYITRTQEFMSLPFEVGPGVLVPRQDTELLVETVMKMVRSREELQANGPGREPPFEILDIGTGSGCIAVSLARFLPHSRVTAVDKMQAALDTAQRNAAANGVAHRIEFVKSDLFSGIAGKQFNAIVSNPPYIRTGDIAGLQREVRDHEPREALDGGVDGLQFYREIIRHAPAFLRREGILAFETGYDQAAEVAKLMAERFGQIMVCKDLAGIDRVAAGFLL